MLKTINLMLREAAKAVKKGRNILENRTVFSLIAVFTTSVAIFMLTGLLYFRNEVIITDGEKVVRALTALEDADEILAERGYVLGEDDYYFFSGFENNTAHLEIIRAPEPIEEIRDTGEQTAQTTTFWLPEETSIFNAVPETQSALAEETTDEVPEIEITLTADGTSTKIIKTVKKDATDRTVAAILKENDIVLGEEDLLTPALTDIINKDTEIVVKRVKYAERITVKSIPYKTEYIETTLETIGYNKLVTRGINGSEQIETLEKIIDGEVVSSEVLSVAVTNEPVTEVRIIGTALAEPYSKREFDEIDLDNGRPSEYEYIVSGKACAYTAGPKSGTASGRDLIVGTVAVDPKIIPYGSLLYIVAQDGSRVYGAAVAADTGDLTDVVVDVYMGLTSEHYKDACNWGAQFVDVYVINTGKY